MNKGMVKSYRKKPVSVEAIQFTGDNYFECMDFIRGHVYRYNTDVPQVECFSIRTLHGLTMVNKGDFIVKDEFGGFFPCKQDIFLETYEEIT